MTEFLDTSLIQDKAVAKALPQLLTDQRMKKRWSTIDARTLSLHRAILSEYLRTGAPPNTRALNNSILTDLCNRDLIVMEKNNISAAYPFSTAPTRHSVEINGVRIANVCAIDALGSGAMAGAASCVTSQCATCDRDVIIDVDDDGLTVLNCVPETSRVWAGIVPIAGCAATTQCKSMLLFCCQEHLNDWCDAAAQRPTGFNFTPAQGVQVGAAIFSPFMLGPSEDTC